MRCEICESGQLCNCEQKALDKWEEMKQKLKEKDARIEELENNSDSYWKRTYNDSLVEIAMLREALKEIMETTMEENTCDRCRTALNKYKGKGIMDLTEGFAGFIIGTIFMKWWMKNFLNYVRRGKK